MPLDGIRRFIELRDADSVKFDHLAQFIDKNFEELLGFTVGADGLRDADERLVARGYRLLGWLEAYLRRFAHQLFDAANRPVGSSHLACGRKDCLYLKIYAD